MKDLVAYALALGIGSVLFVVPFAPYGLTGNHQHGEGAHMDHQPRHGGHLLMLQDVHLELVERPDRIELYLSDAERRPLRPSSCEVSFDARDPVPCRWRGYRSVVEKPARAKTGDYQLTSADGTVLAFRFP